MVNKVLGMYVLPFWKRLALYTTLIGGAAGFAYSTGEKTTRPEVVPASFSVEVQQIKKRVPLRINVTKNHRKGGLSKDLKMRGYSDSEISAALLKMPGLNPQYKNLRIDRHYKRGFAMPGSKKAVWLPVRDGIPCDVVYEGQELDTGLTEEIFAGNKVVSRQTGWKKYEVVDSINVGDIIIYTLAGAAAGAAAGVLAGAGAYLAFDRKRGEYRVFTKGEAAAGTAPPEPPRHPEPEVVPKVIIPEVVAKVAPATVKAEAVSAPKAKETAKKPRRSLYQYLTSTLAGAAYSPAYFEPNPSKSEGISQIFQQDLSLDNRVLQWLGGLFRKPYVETEPLKKMAKELSEQWKNIRKYMKVYGLERRHYADDGGKLIELNLAPENPAELPKGGPDAGVFKDESELTGEKSILNRFLLDLHKGGLDSLKLAYGENDADGNAKLYAFDVTKWHPAHQNIFFTRLMDANRERYREKIGSKGKRAAVEPIYVEDAAAAGHVKAGAAPVPVIVPRADDPYRLPGEIMAAEERQFTERAAAMALLHKQRAAALAFLEELRAGEKGSRKPYRPDTDSTAAIEAYQERVSINFVGEWQRMNAIKEEISYLDAQIAHTEKEVERAQKRRWYSGISDFASWIAFLARKPTRAEADDHSSSSLEWIRSTAEISTEAAEREAAELPELQRAYSALLKEFNANLRSRGIKPFEPFYLRDIIMKKAAQPGQGVYAKDLLELSRLLSKWESSRSKHAENEEFKILDAYINLHPELAALAEERVRLIYDRRTDWVPPAEVGAEEPARSQKTKVITVEKAAGPEQQDSLFGYPLDPEDASRLGQGRRMIHGLILAAGLGLYGAQGTQAAVLSDIKKDTAVVEAPPAEYYSRPSLAESLASRGFFVAAPGEDARIHAENNARTTAAAAEPIVPAVKESAAVAEPVSSNAGSAAPSNAWYKNYDSGRVAEMYNEIVAKNPQMGTEAAWGSAMEVLYGVRAA